MKLLAKNTQNILFNLEYQNISTVQCSAAQKIKKLSETPGTVLIVAKLCMIDSKNRKIAEKLVQPVTPHLSCFQFNGDYNGEIPKNGFWSFNELGAC